VQDTGRVIADELDAEGNVVQITANIQDEASKKFAHSSVEKRSHNEQIFVAPCGDIIARETFFGLSSVQCCRESCYLLNVPTSFIYKNN